MAAPLAAIVLIQSCVRRYHARKLLVSLRAYRHHAAPLRLARLA